VDYVFVLVRSTPEGFILGKANGIAGLRESETDFQTQDKGADGAPIRVSGDRSHGNIMRAGTRSQTVGIMTHEFGHSLGLPDLYDRKFSGPADDSAGIGRWGLMGRGKASDGPRPFCPWSLEQLGWIGPDNDKLVAIGEDVTGLTIADLQQGGQIYSIPFGTEFFAVGWGSATYSPGYLLLEYRSRESYYNRNLPGEGLLVWHVRSRPANNNKEEKKLVDLICADGLYDDEGNPNRQAGFDHLDFWAPDARYRTAHKGNLGDETDPFDGRRRAHFGHESNPSTDIDGSESDARTGLDIQMRRDGDVMQVDVQLPRWAGSVNGMCGGWATSSSTAISPLVPRAVW